MRISQSEKRFKGQYPHANVRDTGRGIAGYKVIAVYAGEYLCAEGLTVAEAYKRAQEYVDAGMINPDPAERAGAFTK
jgi:hypothetical protein